MLGVFLDIVDVHSMFTKYHVEFKCINLAIKKNHLTLDVT